MTAESFNNWLAEMKSAGLIRFDNDAAKMLEISADTMVRYKNNGTDRKTALACRALLHRMEPYQ